MLRIDAVRKMRSHNFKVAPHRAATKAALFGDAQQGPRGPAVNAAALLHQRSA